MKRGLVCLLSLGVFIVTFSIVGFCVLLFGYGEVSDIRNKMDSRRNSKSSESVDKVCKEDVIASPANEGRKEDVIIGPKCE